MSDIPAIVCKSNLGKDMSTEARQLLTKTRERMNKYSSFLAFAHIPPAYVNYEDIDQLWKDCKDPSWMMKLASLIGISPQRIVRITCNLLQSVVDDRIKSFVRILRDWSENVATLQQVDDSDNQFDEYRDNKQVKGCYAVSCVFGSIPTGNVDYDIKIPNYIGYAINEALLFGLDKEVACAKIKADLSAELVKAHVNKFIDKDTYYKLWLKLRLKQPKVPIKECLQAATLIDDPLVQKVVKHAEYLQAKINLYETCWKCQVCLQSAEEPAYCDSCYSYDNREDDDIISEDLNIVEEYEKAHITKS